MHGPHIKMGSSGAWDTTVLVLIVTTLTWATFVEADIRDILAELKFEDFTLKHNCHSDPDLCRNVTQLITSKGYPCEQHNVITPDGFILGVQRIPHGRNESSYVTRPVVFLQHGLLASASDWVVNSAEDSLGFVLADAGYDVWLGNMRGNTYSRKHTKYDPSSKEFWDFSWDEMAMYDLPAMLDHSLKVTGQEALFYVGHSQGTLIGFAEFSRNQNLAKKIKKFFALGPVSTVAHITGAVKWLSYISTDLQDFFNLFGYYEFLPNNMVMKILGKYFCRAPVKFVCEDIIFLIAGSDSTHLNVSRLPVYISHSPAGTSVKNMAHFGQMVRSGLFQMYDYGSVDENIAHYNQPTAPLYNPMKLMVPVALFTADKDPLADPQDVSNLVEELPYIIYQKEIYGWNHLDFIWAKDAAKEVYSEIIKLLKTGD